MTSSEHKTWNAMGVDSDAIATHMDHGDFLSAYGHLTDRQVNVGDKVKKGEQIALSGGGQGKANGAGSSTGPHLHFEIRKFKGALKKDDFENPEPYLSGKSPSKSDNSKSDVKKPKIGKKLTFSGFNGSASNNIRLLIKKMKNKGIKDPIAQLGILATIGKESNFIPQNEIGYCTTPDANIITIFRNRGKKCKSHKCDDEKFFDCVYGKDSGISSSGISSKYFPSIPQAPAYSERHVDAK
jgi:hypothetical protein